MALDPTGWQPVRGDGAEHGWHYRVAAPAPGGIRKVILRPGRIALIAKGSDWPCDLSSSQRVPLSVRFVFDDNRYCASFGGDVKSNRSGLFTARNATAPLRCAEKDDVTIANLNILHGLGCGPDLCRFSDRVDLFFDWVVDAGCPDLVTLQEVFGNTVGTIEARLASVCPFPYESAYITINVVDDAMILSRYPIGSAEVTNLWKDFRNVLHARVDHPIGPIDVFSTHLASGADGAGLPCDVGCPPECVAAGAVNTRECQAVQAVLLVEERHDISTPAFLTGDFNAEPGEFEYLEVVDRGWVDTHLAAGNPECVLATGVGCGGARGGLADLESPAVLVDERIDFIFVVPPPVGSCSLDSGADDDGDGTSTGLWADAPNPFAPSCGPSPDPICWPSDHNGNQADLECG
jgi:endonuclease/exonuclease/phosphatase family metal-dependent hydrolase